MRPFIVALSIAFLALGSSYGIAGNARAAGAAPNTMTLAGGDAYALLFPGKQLAWEANLPSGAADRITSLTNSGHTIKSVGIAPGGGWAVLFDFNGAYYSDGLPADLTSKIDSIIAETSTELRAVTFGPQGSWVLLFGDNGVWEGGVPQSLQTRLQNELSGSHVVKSVALGSNNTWVILFDDNGAYWSGGVPQDLQARIHQLQTDNDTLSSVALGPSGGWAIFFGDDDAYYGGLATEPAQKLADFLAQ